MHCEKYMNSGHILLNKIIYNIGSYWNLHFYFCEQNKSNIINDSNYKYKKMEKMLVSSDKEEELIEPKEFLQRQQDPKVSAFDMI